MLRTIQINADKPADTTPAPAANVVDTVNGGVQVTPPVESPAATPPTPPATPERPTWLPEKFKTVEDMAKAYGELESRMGKPPEKPAPTAAQEAAKATLDMAALSAEYIKDGKLSEASTAKLTAAGITAEEIAEYAKGQQAVAAQLTSEVAQIAGGTEQLKSVLEWARVNLSKDDAAAYDAAVDSGNVALVKMAMQGVMAQYTTANGKAPQLVNAEAAPSTAVQPFASNAQVIDAMRDPKYQKDPAYRKQVAERLRVSPNFGG